MQWLWYFGAALCTGTDLRTDLSAEDRAEITAEVSAEPYADSIGYDALRGGARLALLDTVHLAQVEVPPLVTDTLADARLLLVEATEDDSAEAQVALRTRRDLILGDPNQPLSVDLTGDEWSSVVGAAHLPGETGLLALLGKEGFTLTPLDPFTPSQ